MFENTIIVPQLLITKLLFDRYASLYFVAAIEPEDNELLALEVIHRYVELLDKYFGNVCYIPFLYLSITQTMYDLYRLDISISLIAL